MSTDHETLAYCWTYCGLMNALKVRRKELGLSQLEVDDKAGLQDGYCGKLEAWDRDSGRRLGPVSFDLLLAAYGVGLVLFETRPPAERPEYDPSQLGLSLEGGGMRRHHDGEFVRLPGRNRRREAKAAAEAAAAEALLEIREAAE
ncbi:hypothetical protein EZH22_30300 (plasmid) [Xanthobacter dioxanivorans]|uniref:Uncharacterized protein n=1 Tax=Xanthobacter dioxanivorans TaxID=2528964 RepID=A0A974PVS5_9HYPH|nr:hypothetical protein [Xanthobacter dioxanivorans]QRG10173.1 hypothetical protein EZH22_30300 [Xanthobacter dioxanivorans]